jgi:hypothetical protein
MATYIPHKTDVDMDTALFLKTTPVSSVTACHTTFMPRMLNKYATLLHSFCRFTHFKRSRLITLVSSMCLTKFPLQCTVPAIMQLVETKLIML